MLIVESYSDKSLISHDVSLMSPTPSLRSAMALFAAMNNSTLSGFYLNLYTRSQRALPVPGSFFPGADHFPRKNWSGGPISTENFGPGDKNFQDQNSGDTASRD